MKPSKDDFLEIISNYQAILHKVSLIYFRDKADREDNFQEIVYQLWKSFSKLKDVSNLGSWIYTVAINTSISKFKKNKRMEYYEKLPDILESSEVYDEMSLNEDIQILLNAIYNLNEIDKSIMLLYLEEKSYDEIAEIIGISKSNVGVRINRAKDLLKQNLKNISYGK